MLIIFKEPIKLQNAACDVLAMNLEDSNEVIILQVNNQFQLAIVKHFDGHFSSHSFLQHTLDTFDSYEKCLELFQQLVDALRNDERVFDLRVDPESSDLKQKRRSGVH